jgi:hypothetical protein
MAGPLGAWCTLPRCSRSVALHHSQKAYWLGWNKLYAVRSQRDMEDLAALAAHAFRNRNLNKGDDMGQAWFCPTCLNAISLPRFEAGVCFNEPRYPDCPLKPPDEPATATSEPQAPPNAAAA